MVIHLFISRIIILCQLIPVINSLQKDFWKDELATGQYRMTSALHTVTLRSDGRVSFTEEMVLRSHFAQEKPLA